MKKILVLVVLLGLTGCKIGDFEERNKLYGNNNIADICVSEPSLCEDEATEW